MGRGENKPSPLLFEQGVMNMNKMKLCISDVLPCAGNLCVAFALMDDGDDIKEIQVCLPKSCGIEKCVGKEIYYEMRNGKVRISEVRQPEPKVDIPAQDVESGEE